MAKPFSHLATLQTIEEDWIIPKLLQRRNTLFLLGEPKKAVKSWLLLNLAWDLSEGKPVWGIHRSGNHPNERDYLFQSPRPMRSIYFSQEDTEQNLKERVDLMVAAGRKLNDNFWYVEKDLSLMLTQPGGMQKIRDHIKQAAPVDLVIFDPFRRMHMGDENDSRAINEMWANISLVQKEFDCGTIFSHHLKKLGMGDDAASPNAGRGSTDISGGADAILNVVSAPLRNEPPQRRLTIHYTLKRALPITATKLSVSFETGLVSWLGFYKKKQSGNDEESEE